MEDTKFRNVFVLLFLVLLSLNIFDTVVTCHGIGKFDIGLEFNFIIRSLIERIGSPLVAICLCKSIILFIPLIFFVSKKDSEKKLMIFGLTIANVYYAIFICIFHLPYLLFY